MERLGGSGNSSKSREDRLLLEPPRIVIVTGVAGTGKTSLVYGFNIGERVLPGLSDCLFAVCLSKDQIADRFTDRRDEWYRATVRPRVYKRIFRSTEGAINEGRTVVIDANFGYVIGKADWEKPYRDLVAKHGALLKLIRIVATPDVIRNRLIERNLPYDQDKQQKEGFRRWLEGEPIEVEMPQGSLIVENNGAGDFSTVLNRALEFIRTG